MQNLIIFSIVSALIVSVDCSTGQVNEDFSFLEYVGIIALVSLFSSGLGFVYYDRRNGYRIISNVRAKYGQIKTNLIELKNRVANRKKKVEFEETPQSSKSTMDVFESQKTYSEVEMNSMQDAMPNSNHNEGISGMEIVEDTSKVNLKDVFENKEIAGRNQKRSKSKLKGKVVYKKEAIEENVEHSLQMAEEDTESNNKPEQS